MARSYRSIARKEHGSNRFANHQRTADHDNVCTVEVDSVVIQYRQHCLGSTGRITSTKTAQRRKQRRRSHAVNVLLWQKRRRDRISFEMFRKRTEYQAPMNGRVFINLGNGAHQIFLGNICGQKVATAGNANFFTTLESPALIGEVILALAHAHDCQRGHDPQRFQFPRSLDQLGGNCLCDRCALE